MTFIYKFIKIFKLLFIFVIIVLSFSNAYARQFVDKEYIIIDLLNGVEWLRCSTGQTWNGSDCEGEVVRLNLKEVEQAIKQANEQLEGTWRLPTRKELEGLVCSSCLGTKVDKEFFPSTPAEPFWTSDRNWWSPKFFWSVNFFTGHSYGRFVPEKELFVRFVKDR